jgi:hypothetical protein
MGLNRHAPNNRLQRTALRATYASPLDFSGRFWDQSEFFIILNLQWRIKMKFKIYFLFYAALLLFSCSTSSEPLIIENVPLGIWVYSKNIDNISIYYSAVQFETDKPGIALEDKYIFIDRTSGWCATPPLFYSNIEGKWSIYNKNTLKISCPNWINENYFRLMEIVYLSDTELQVIYRDVPE